MTVDLGESHIAAICHILAVEENRLERITLNGKRAATARSRLRDVKEALARLREALRDESGV